MTLTFASERIEPVPESPNQTTLFRARRGNPRPAYVLLVVLGLALLAVGSLLIPRLLQPRDPVEEAAARIAGDCAGGRQIENESLIMSGLTDYLSKVTANAKVRSNDVGVVTSKITATKVGADMYAQYTACLHVRTDDYLRMRGNLAGPPASMNDATLQAVTPAAEDTQALIVTGWAYYEERDGRPTSDGVIVPPGTGLAPRYSKLMKNMILRSTHAFNLRVSPDKDAELIATMPDGQVPSGKCVKVLSAPTHPTPVAEATSGGKIEVQMVHCPP